MLIRLIAGIAISLLCVASSSAQGTYDNRFAIPYLDGGIVGMAEVSNGDLIVAGDFRWAGNVRVEGLARWDGSKWSQFPGWTDSGVGPFCNAHDTIYVVTGYPAKVLSYDGSAWHSIPIPNTSPYGVSFMATQGKYIAIARNMSNVHSSVHMDVFLWDGLSWDSLGEVEPPYGSGLSSLIFNGDYLYLGGQFDSINEQEFHNIARWSLSAHRWERVGDSDGDNGTIDCLTVGPGNLLYAGGSFASIGNVGARNVAVWNDTTWAPIGTWQNVIVGEVQSIQFSGDEMYVEGKFQKAGRVVANNILHRSNGLWITDMDCPADSLAQGIFIGAHAKYINRQLSNGDEEICRWDGASWNLIDTATYLGLAGVVNQIIRIASDVYVAGHFATADHQNISNLARWDGVQWHHIGSNSTDSIYRIGELNGHLIADGIFHTHGPDRETMQELDDTGWRVTSLPAMTVLMISDDSILYGEGNGFFDGEGYASENTSGDIPCYSDYLAVDSAHQLYSLWNNYDSTLIQADYMRYQLCKQIAVVSGYVSNYGYHLTMEVIGNQLVVG